MQLIPVLSVEVLDIGAESYGLLLGFVRASVPSRWRRSSARSTNGCCPAGSSPAASPSPRCAIVGLGFTPTVAIGVLCMVVYGGAYVTVASMNLSTIQSLSGDHIRGRITSLWLMTFGT